MKNLWLLLFIVSIRPTQAQLFGGQIKSPRAIISQLNCANATVSATVYSNVALNVINVTIPIIASNGGTYISQSYNSTGVTGLTLTCGYGMIPSGSSNVVFTLSGTANTVGNAQFNVALGGQTCSFSVAVVSWANQYPPNSVFCANGPTAIVDVTNPTTGKTWMDRNLGATQVAASSTDQNAYGDLYQWGRRTDGHQCRTSPTTGALSSVDQPAHGSFILAPSAPYDWRYPQNANLWQGVNGVNNPCPSGYRLPTETELNNERLSWSSNNSAGAFASSLKWPVAGHRDDGSGYLYAVGAIGLNWSSTVSGGSYSRHLYFSSSNSNASMGDDLRASGLSVRCLKETVGSVGALNCNGATQSGNLFSGQAASNVTANLPYTGGNGGYYAAQTTASTGVTGLTATLSQGILINGAGSLNFTISGTPASAGSASFAISVGGQSCSFTLNVAAIGQYPAGTVHCAGDTTVVDVINPATGKTWMDRNLGATSTIAHSSSYGDLYQWGRNSDGHQCRTSLTTSSLSSLDQPGHGLFIIASNSPNDWRSPQNVNLWQGNLGLNNPCPIGYRIPTNNELNNERLTWNFNNASGAFNSPLKWQVAGDRNSTGNYSSNGWVGWYWSCTLNGLQSLYLHIDGSNAAIASAIRMKGHSIRCIKELSSSVNSINCAGSTLSTNINSGVLINNVVLTIPYLGGNSGFYAAQSIASNGVAGITANIAAGNFANGNGNLNYILNGTPLSSGIASFNINIGGQSCSVSFNIFPPIYPANSVFCAGGATAIVDVTNPITGKTWMDRNLGASQVASSSIDQNSYGDLYQWGRGSDGHQCRNSPQQTYCSNNLDQPGHNKFILGGQCPNYDWRNPQNSNLWQGSAGINNPCPSGYRIPTEAELNDERLSWNNNNANGGFTSPLKWTLAGNRHPLNGGLEAVGTGGRYWTSITTGAYSRFLSFDSNNAVFSDLFRAYGFSVRCIKN